MKSTMALFVALLFLNAQALSQSLTPPIKPFVNQSTLVIARINVATVDFNSLDRLGRDLGAQLAPAEKRDAMSNQVHSAVESTEQWSKQFIKAGGKTFWAVLSLDDPHGSPFFVIPLEGGADAETLKTAFSGNGRYTVEQRGSSLIASDQKEVIDRLKNLTPADRPELFRALDSADPNADLILAAAASPDSKKVLESMLPRLPDNQPSTPLTRDLSFVSVWIKSSARTGRILLQSTDEAAAQRLRDTLLSLLRQQQGAQGADVHNVEPLLITLGQLVRQSKVEKDRLVIDLGPDSTTQLAARTAEGIAMARERARRVQSMNNIKQLVLACIIYANDKKDGQYPATLEEAVKTLDGGNNLLTNPRLPRETPGYLYIPPADGLKADANRLVIYEKFTKWEGVCAGFADGHCEFIADQGRFQKLLDTATAKKAGGGK